MTTWQFWRAGFWTRPVLLAMLLIPAVALVIAAGIQVAGAERRAHAMESAPICGGSIATNCLAPRVGVLVSFYAKGPGEYYAIDTGGRPHDNAMVDTSTSARLDHYLGTREVIGLTWDRHLVAFLLPDGQVRTSLGFGYRATQNWVALLLFLLVVPAVVLFKTLEKRRLSPTWWAVPQLDGGPQWAPPPRLDLAVRHYLLVAFVGCCPASLVYLASVLALPIWAGWALGAAFGALVVVDSRRKGIWTTHPSRGRHTYPEPDA